MSAASDQREADYREELRFIIAVGTIVGVLVLGFTSVYLASADGRLVSGMLRLLGTIGVANIATYPLAWFVRGARR